MDNIVYFLHVRERTFESKIILQKPKDASLSTGRIIILLGLRQVGAHLLSYNTMFIV